MCFRYFNYEILVINLENPGRKADGDPFNRQRYIQRSVSRMKKTACVFLALAMLMGIMTSALNDSSLMEGQGTETTSTITSPITHQTIF